MGTPISIAKGTCPNCGDVAVTVEICVKCDGDGLEVVSGASSVGIRLCPQCQGQRKIRTCSKCGMKIEVAASEGLE